MRYRKRRRHEDYLTLIVNQRVWRALIEWQCRKDKILFYWGLLMLSVLAGFSVAILVYNSLIHIKTGAALSIWYLVRRLTRHITDTRL
jgi:hypothetical protein